MNPYQVDRNQAEIEARAKISWGDPPMEVVKYLMMQGIPYEEAAPMVDAMFQERAAIIRKTGITRVVMGFGLMCLPVLTWLYALVSWKLLALTVMGGAWGLWMFIKGIFMIASPTTESGDVADK